MFTLRLKTLLRHFNQNEQGVISIMFALFLPLLVGFMALGADAGIWHVNQRNMQSAADAAAVTVVRQLGSIGDAEILSLAQSESSRNGFPQSDGVTITAVSPPSSGIYTSNANAVEVTLSKPQDRFFSKLYTSGDPTATVRSVAIKTTSSEACVLALNPTASGAISFSGNVDIELDGCVIAANSSDSSAMTINGNVDVTAESLHMVGNYTASGGAYSLNLDDPATVNGPLVQDPYADLPDPSYGGCDETNYRASGTVTLTPGVYCNGLTINNSANVTLSPGTYYIHEDSFKVNGNASLTGSGVTIILTGTDDDDIATLDINGASTLDLSASTSGTYEGVLIYQDRDATSSGSNKINGNASTSLDGTIYIPSQEVDFSGNSTTSSSCLRLVSDTVVFTGNAGFSHDCSAIGGESVTTELSIALVE